MTNTTLSGTPSLLSPANAEVWFKFDNGSYSVGQFKYIIEVYTVDDNSVTLSDLGQYKIPPRPSGGSGLFTPHRILLSQLGYTLDPTYVGSSSFCFATESNILERYSINYGFEYNPGITFSDTIISGTSVGFTFSTLHPFIVDDVININKDNKNINAYYDGQARVIGYGSYSITIDKAIGVTGSIETGLINSLQRVHSQTDDFYVYNGTRQYNDIGYDFTSDYVVGGATGGYKFLTNITTEKLIRESQYETAQFLCYGTYSSQPNFGYTVKTFGSANNQIGTYSFTYSYSNPSDAIISYILPTGTKNLNGLGVSFSSVDRYEIHLRSGSSYLTQSKAILYRKIDSRCSNYSTVRIAYMNSFGAFDYMNFTLDKKETLSINRSEYKKILPYNYSIGDRGQTVLSQKVDHFYQLTSDWMTETDYNYLAELIYSPEVYIIDEDGSGISSVASYQNVAGNKYPVIIMDSNFEYKTYIRNGLLNLVMSVKTGFEINTQTQ